MFGAGRETRTRTISDRQHLKLVGVANSPSPAVSRLTDSCAIVAERGRLAHNLNGCRSWIRTSIVLLNRELHYLLCRIRQRMGSTRLFGRTSRNAENMVEIRRIELRKNCVQSRPLADRDDPHVAPSERFELPTAAFEAQNSIR